MNFKDENALDLEWVMLIMEAKETGISIEEVRQFYKVLVQILSRYISKEIKNSLRIANLYSGSQAMSTRCIIIPLQ